MNHHSNWRHRELLAKYFLLISSNLGLFQIIKCTIQMLIQYDLNVRISKDFLKQQIVLWSLFLQWLSFLFVICSVIYPFSFFFHNFYHSAVWTSKNTTEIISEVALHVCSLGSSGYSDMIPGFVFCDWQEADYYLRGAILWKELKSHTTTTSPTSPLTSAAFFSTLGILRKVLKIVPDSAYSMYLGIISLRNQNTTEICYETRLSLWKWQQLFSWAIRQ